MSQDVMDVKEVSQYLGVAKATIYKWVEQRQIPYTKVGNLLRFPKWLIDQHLTKKAVHPDEELYQEFVKLAGRYHLEQWLKTQGLDLERMSEEQLLDALRRSLTPLVRDYQQQF